jgi:hypothetical protein
VPHARVIYNLGQFKVFAKPEILRNLSNNLAVVPSYVTHEVVWDILQAQDCEEDTFKKLNAWDWLRNIFPGIGSQSIWPMMVRWGDFGGLTIKGVIKDLRSEKYSRGPQINIVPLYPNRVEVSNREPVTNTYEGDYRRYQSKIFVRRKL